MALYKITNVFTDKVRLVRANTPAAALRHVAKVQFAIEVITDPAEGLEFAQKHSIRMEVAGEEPEPLPPVEESSPPNGDLIRPAEQVDLGDAGPSDALKGNVVEFPAGAEA